MVFTHDKAGRVGASDGAADPRESTAAGGRSALTLSFDSPAATLESCGGKGINLVRLTRAGFRVPPGFVVSADAYRLFVAANDLTTRLGDIVAGVDPGDAAALEAASGLIRRAFADGAIPAEVVEAVRAAWEQTFEPDSALAVRSSATAEDLPDLSFAGQQDTFLNVVGLDAVMEALVSCWSSLWTARAIGYRARNGIPHDGVALAAVVQLLVPARASGVLFTANPLTGARTETVIDATWGLGEALVSGQVEPDHFVVHSESGRISRSVGAKAVVTSALPGGGVTISARVPDPELSLTDAQVWELVALGRSVADEYGTPQDLEWAIADATIYLLQARAITSLYPVPTGGSEALWFSFGAIQGMLQPITPLGRDAISMMLSGVTELVGPRVDLARAGYLTPAGERLWIRIDGIVHHRLGGRILPRVLPMLEPSFGEILAGLAREAGWAPRPGRPSWATVRGLARLAAQVVPQIPGSVLTPVRRRRGMDARMAALLADAQRRQVEAGAEDDPWARLAARARAMRATLEGWFPVVVRAFIPIIGPGMAMMLRVKATAHEAGDQAQVLAMEVLRGLPGNVTTEMDLALWRTAADIQAEPASLRAFGELEATELADRYAAGQLPTQAQGAVAAFLAEYGMRGVGEIDLGVPRWRENPIDVMRSLQSYTQIRDPEQAPDAVFARGAARAARAKDKLSALLISSGGVRSRGRAARARFMIGRMRTLLGARETPKFTMIRALGLVREGLLASGGDLVRAGVLDRAEDVFFLHVDELERLRAEPAEVWRSVVAARRDLADRERRRRQVPRVIAGDGRAFYEGVGSVDGAMSGSPVSPGIAEGLVRVVFDPQTTHLLPGEILVCPGTDPAWTPLFLSAGGLITEVGGMMTHGSVVAREYGIPAVVGVHQATARLHTGQRIRLDGMTGTIEILDEASDPALSASEVVDGGAGAR